MESKEQTSLLSKSLQSQLSQPKIQLLIRISNLLVFVACLLVNYLVGSKGNADISKKYQLPVTPPGYFFTIWIIIFSSLALAIVYEGIKGFWPMKTHGYFLANSLLLIVWNLIFVQGSLTAVCCDFLVIILNASIAYLLWKSLQQVKQQDKFYATRLIIAFYLGWMIAAANLNFGIVLVYLLGVSKNAQMVIFWIMAPSCAVAAFLLNGKLQGKRGLTSCVSLWMSVAWAFAGAGISTNNYLNN